MKRLFLCVILFAATLIFGCVEEEVPIFGDVYGTIKDSLTGEPIRNAEVILSPTNMSTISGSDGHFEFHSLEAKQYTISVASSGYESNSRQITIIPGQSISCDIMLKPQSASPNPNPGDNNQNDNNEDNNDPSDDNNGSNEDNPSQSNDMYTEPAELDFGTDETQMYYTLYNVPEWSSCGGSGPVGFSRSLLSRTKNEDGKYTYKYRVDVDREEITSPINSTMAHWFNDQANTVSIIVKATPSPADYSKGKMSVSPEVLNFAGDEDGIMSFEVSNTGSSLLKWDVTYDKDLLRVDDNDNGIITSNMKAGTTVSYNVELRNNNVVDTYITLTNKYDSSNTHKIHVIAGKEDTSELTGNKIYYTSTDGQIVTPNKEDGFGANIASNTYENGQGVITFHSNITAIGQSAFSSCVTLETITIPETVTKIGANAFRYCTALTELTIPESVTEIGYSAFESCNNLTAFYGKFASADNRSLVADGVLTAFAPYDLTTYAIPEGVTKVGYYVFSNCSNLAEITIPDGVTTIDSGAFWSCTSLSSITIPESVIAIGDGVFGGCTNLAEFNGAFATEDKLALIVEGSFISAAHNAMPDTYTIPSNATSIRAYAFFGSSALANVTIPEGVTLLDLGAFYACEALVEVHSQPTTPPTFGDQALDGAPDELKIYVPASSVDAYRQADGWYAFAEKIVAEPGSEGEGNEGNEGTGEDDGNTPSTLYVTPEVLDFGTDETPLYYTLHNIPQWTSCSGSQPGEVNIVTLKKTKETNGREEWYIRVDLDRDRVTHEINGSRGHWFNDESAAVTIKAQPSTLNYMSGKISVSPTVLYFSGNDTNEALYIDVTNTGSSHLKYDVTYDSSYILYDERDDASKTIIVKPGSTVTHLINPRTNGAFSTTITLTNKYNSADVHKIRVVSGVTVSEIHYTSTDGKIVEPNKDAFSAEIASNTYENGQGVITLAGDINSMNIGDNAFEYCTTLETITIPDNIISIGSKAFYSCTGLTSIKLPESVNSIGDYAFGYCSSLTSINIPSGVSTIDLGTFQNCTALESITIHNNVTTIKAGAFASCSALTSVTLPNSVSAIGNKAFMGCTSLTAINIPDAVTKIEASTFASCSSLTSITIPADIRTIGEKAFDSCSAIAEVQCLPTTPPSLGANAFNGVAEGCKIYVPSGTYSAYAAAEGWAPYVPMIVNEHANGLIEVSNTELDFGIDQPHLTFTITNIGTSALQWQIADIPAYLTIDKQATTASGTLDVGASTDLIVVLDRATMPDEVDINLALANVHNAEDTHTLHITAQKDYVNGDIEVTPEGINFGFDLTTAKLTIRNAGTGALQWAINDAPEYITFGDGQSTASGTLETGANTTLDLVLDRKTMPGELDANMTVVNLHNENDTHTVHLTGINEVAKNKIYYTTTNGQVTDIYETSVFGANIVSNEYVNGQGVITFSGDITSVGERAFNGCTTLESIIIPEGVTSIGSKAFKNCAGLKSVQIPSTVTEIGDEAFYECAVLTSVKLPAGLTSLGVRAFQYCRELLSINIPSGITEIKERAFYDCYKLNNITLPEGLTTIGTWAFGYNWELTSINIPSSVTFIGGYAFEGLDKLSEVHITDLTAWCNITFENAESNPVSNRHWESNVNRDISSKFYVNKEQVTHLVIPYNITVIKPYTFNNCDHITTITIHDAVTEIGQYAFGGCRDVSTITIGSSVQTIGNGAFQDTDSLTTIYCKPTTPPNNSGGPSIQGANEKIYVPEESTSAYRTANAWSNYADNIWGHTF